MKAAQVFALALASSAALGWFARSSPTVHAAADSGPVEFQLQGTGPGAQLGIYYETDKDLYVYPGIGAGSSSVNCSYKLHIGRAGAPVERTNCGAGKLQ